MLPAFIIDELNRQKQPNDEQPLAIPIDLELPHNERVPQPSPPTSEAPRGVIEIDYCL
ncbi:MAG: hypothetical protein M0R76_12950 [Proteobacteria bacterium]|nr:hypothetical protein [Pseudomonadota bacterium]